MSADSHDDLTPLSPFDIFQLADEVETEKVFMRPEGGGLHEAGAASGEDLPDLGGRYHPIKWLGQGGGMGRVLKASDPELGGRLVALKFLHDKMEDDPGLRPALQHEASFLARLEHPGIVGVYTWGVHEGRGFIVMKFIEGETLSEWLTRTRSDRSDRMKVLLQVADALAHAHEQEVSHRDINLNNIMIRSGTTDLQAVVVDFGIASLPELPSVFTQNGMRPHTFHFASIEQRLNQPVNYLTDVYSLGKTAYYVLRAEVPRPDSPHLESDDLELPGEPALCHVLRKATAYPKEKRYQSMKQFADALRAADQPRWLRWSLLISGPVLHRIRKPMAYGAGLILASAVLLPSYFQPAQDARVIPKVEAPRIVGRRFELKFARIGPRVLLSTHRISRAAFKQFAEETMEAGTVWKERALWPGISADDNDPVAGITWRQASAFCDWLSRKDGKHYRLPTLDEWLVGAGPKKETDALIFNALASGDAPWLPVQPDPYWRNRSYKRELSEFEQWHLPNSKGIEQISLSGWEWTSDTQMRRGRTCRVAVRGRPMAGDEVVYYSYPPEEEATEIAMITGAPSPEGYKGLDLIHFRDLPQPMTFRCVLEDE